MTTRLRDAFDAIIRFAVVVYLGGTGTMEGKELS
jgi:hypothetical protein